MLKLHFFAFLCLELKKRCIFVSTKTNNNLNHKQNENNRTTNF